MVNDFIDIDSGELGATVGGLDGTDSIDVFDKYGIRIIEEFKIADDSLFHLHIPPNDEIRIPPEKYLEDIERIFEDKKKAAQEIDVVPGKVIRPNRLSSNVSISQTEPRTYTVTISGRAWDGLTGEIYEAGDTSDNGGDT